MIAAVMCQVQGTKFKVKKQGGVLRAEKNYVERQTSHFTLFNFEENEHGN
jgi:hypothetical protein